MRITRRKKMIGIGGSSQGFIIDKKDTKRLNIKKGDFAFITVSKQGDKR